VRVRSAGNAAEEALVIEEVVAGENVLDVKLLEEITGGNGDLAERFVGMIIGPLLKDFAGFREFLNVKIVESFFEFGNGRKRRRIGWRRGRGLCRGRGSEKKEHESGGRQDCVEAAHHQKP